MTANSKLTLIDGKLRVDGCVGPLVLSPRPRRAGQTKESDCCCCSAAQRYFRGFENPDTWFKSIFLHDEDACYFQTEFKPDGSIKLTAVERDDPNIPSGKSYCGLFKVTDGSNWFTKQYPIGTYISRGEGGWVLGGLWSPPAPGGQWKLRSNTKIVLDAGPNDFCKNFGDKIWFDLSDEVSEDELADL